MYKGKAFCEASIYLYSKLGTPEEELAKNINTISTFQNNHIKVTAVTILSTGFDERHNEQFTSLSVYAEILVKYNRQITHLNDYRVEACREFRKHFPSSGAVMAHSIDTYSPYRLNGFM